MLEPAFSELADRQLREVEGHPDRRALWNAICDVVDLICDHPDSALARRELIHLPSGAHIWQIPIRCPVEDDNWVLLWHQDGGDAVIHYVGSALFR
jgi:hypothetical protein